MPQRAELENINTIELPNPGGTKEVKSVLDESANMLSSLTPEGEATYPKAESTLNRMLLSDGLPPIPAKLIERICQWKYIDMSNILL